MRLPPLLSAVFDRPPRWRLGRLYSSVNDPAFIADASGRNGPEARGRATVYADLLRAERVDDPVRRARVQQMLADGGFEPAALAFEELRAAGGPGLASAYRRVIAAGVRAETGVSEAGWAMISATLADHLPALSHVWGALKARRAGKATLTAGGRPAPLAGLAPPRPMRWSEAVRRVIEAFEALDADMAVVARRLFDERRIHARPDRRKLKGAFSHPVPHGDGPFIMLTFTGEPGDVLTLAHEMGHAVHQALTVGAGRRAALPALAETAAGLVEALVFKQLLAGAGPTDRACLLALRAQDHQAHLVRPWLVDWFETALHADPALDPDTEFLMALRAALGPAVRPEAAEGRGWSAVADIARAPFAGRAYPFARLAARALLERQVRDPAGFGRRWREALSVESEPAPALERMGLKVHRPGFWAREAARASADVGEAVALLWPS